MIRLGKGGVMDIKNNENDKNILKDNGKNNINGCGFYIKNILAWLFGISSLFVTFAFVIEGKIAFLPILLFGLLITPPISKRIEELSNIKGYGTIKGIVCTILYFSFIALASQTTKEQNMAGSNIDLTILYVISGFFIIALIFVIKLYIDNKKIKLINNDLITKYSNIIDIDAEIAEHQKQDKEKSDNAILELNKINSQIEELKGLYSTNRKTYEELMQRKALLEEDVEMMAVGLYKPHFNFDDSSTYKNAITQNYEKQKNIVKDKKAIICTTEWTVEGSKVKGKQMTTRNIKLMLKAFNGECDSIISKTKWNNIDKMEARMEKAFDDINQLGEPNHTSIQNSYLKLKYEELYLTHEYEQKKQEEKEEQKRIQEQIREEQKALKEMETARIRAEKEEADFQKALEKAHQQLAQANQEERSKYEDQIAQLQQKLQEAEEMRQRAISQAQLTKSGHIYVISNIGSFGENIYKIGMTRRLEPMERINELGDASVPFKFDVHALIYSEDAPALENKLHEVFRDKSVNLVNLKKEFFKVSLEEIEKVVKENYAEIEFTKIAEAKEYRETLAILNAEKRATEKVEVRTSSDLPLEL